MTAAPLVRAPADVAWKSAPSPGLSRPALASWVAARRSAAVWLQPRFTADRVSRESEVAANQTRAAVGASRAGRSIAAASARQVRRDAGSPRRRAENCAAGAATRGGAVSPLTCGTARRPTDWWLPCATPEPTRPP